MLPPQTGNIVVWSFFFSIPIGFVDCLHFAVHSLIVVSFVGVVYKQHIPCVEINTTRFHYRLL
jgi:hypothetical protein